MVVDTGAQVTVLPQEEIDDLGVVSYGTQNVEGATSSSDNVPAYVINITLDGKSQLEEVFALDGQYLLGLNVLEGYAITMQNGTSMTIAALP